MKAAEIFADPKFNIVAVTISEGYEEEGWTMTEKDRERGSKAKESKSSQEFTPLSGDVN